MQQKSAGSVQVLRLTCEALLFMPTFCSARHLLIEQPNFKPAIENLLGMPLLETLSLVNTEDFRSERYANQRNCTPPLNDRRHYAPASYSTEDRYPYLQPTPPESVD